MTPVQAAVTSHTKVSVPHLSPCFMAALSFPVTCQLGGDKVSPAADKAGDTFRGGVG